MSGCVCERVCAWVGVLVKMGVSGVVCDLRGCMGGGAWVGVGLAA